MTILVPLCMAVFSSDSSKMPLGEINLIGLYGWEVSKVPVLNVSIYTQHSGQHPRNLDFTGGAGVREFSTLP